MEGEKAGDPNAVQRSHDMAIREAIPPNMPPAPDHSRGAPVTTNGHDRLASDIWSGAVSRLQSQSSYNTGMLESHRRQFTEIENNINRLHQEMNNMIAVLNELRAEVRARPPPPPPPPTSEPPSRHDPGDLEVLVGQVQRLTQRVNEIDSLQMQFDLMKNRIKRYEEGTPLPPSMPGPPPPPLPAPTHREHSHYEQPLPPQSHPPLSQHPAQHQPLPPMRTSSVPSPGSSRPPSFPAPSALESQPPPGYPMPPESRSFSNDVQPPHPPPPSAGSYRPGEPLPPPSSLSGWRPAEGYPPPGMSPPTAAAASGSRPHTIEPEPHSTGWTAVNPAMKRPPEERSSPYHSPLVDGTKRPKLAPLMPNNSRPSYGEESYSSTPPSYAPAPAIPPGEAMLQPRSRAPSDGSGPQSQPLPPHPPPPPPSHIPPVTATPRDFRFITTDSPEVWRPDQERMPPASIHAANGRSRGGRGRGRGRGRGGARGGPANGLTSSATPGQPDSTLSQEHGTPEWEKPEIPPTQLSPNGYHPGMHPYSPSIASRGGIVRRGDAHMGGVPSERHHEFPSTPIQASPPENYPVAPDGAQHTSGGKKTRTKPIRNAEGILIRKDGRPDMRSVSSANNLRKVHAKKEAERAEMEDDNDAMTRSGTPVSATAAGDGPSPEESHGLPNDRHHDPSSSSKIFSPSTDPSSHTPSHPPPHPPAHPSSHPPSHARYSPRPSPPVYHKSESEDRKPTGNGENDVVMKEANDGVARGEQDAHMADAHDENAKPNSYHDSPPRAHSMRGSYTRHHQPQQQQQQQQQQHQQQQPPPPPPPPPKQQQDQQQQQQQHHHHHLHHRHHSDDRKSENPVGAPEASGGAARQEAAAA